MCNSRFPVPPSFCKFWLRNRCYSLNAFRSTFPSLAIYACRFHSGQALWRNIQRRSHRWLQIWNWSRPLATSSYGLSIPNDVSGAFAFDIMFCSPTSDKCDKFGDYFCSAYLETTVFPPSLWAQIPSDVRGANNGPESFHRHFNAQFTSPHPTTIQYNTIQ